MNRVLGNVTGLFVVLLSLACTSDEGEAQAFSTRDPICLAGEEQPCLCGKAMRTRSCENGEWGECNCAFAECGNGKVEIGEECDGANLNGENCESATMSATSEGTLSCTSECVFDTSECTTGSLMGGGGTFGQGGSLNQGGTFGQGGLLF